MIPKHTPQAQAPWKRALAEAYREPLTLLRDLGIEPPAALANAGQKQFPMLVPRGFAARMRPGDLNDPLLQQVLPLADEDQPQFGFTADPVGDGAAQAAPGVLHKYHGRVLLIATGGCAINCRYCFRRHFPYAEARAGTRRWQAELEYIATNEDISEVILSGGDPLLIDTPALQALSDALDTMPHVRRLRIHTRLPVVLPERIDDAFLHWSGSLKQRLTVVIHSNHANEIDDDVATALKGLREAGVTLLNQAVLLAGINDTLDAQCELAERYFEHGVLPYYLHQLDRVQGAAHFAVSDKDALALHQAMREKLPGYLLPRLVQEMEGEAAKTPLAE
jgi:EF-P beta-lysylation protein EpmB